jgi:alpha-amylase
MVVYTAYSKAPLTGDPALTDLATWLLQSGPEAEVSAYFTPSEWWELGGHGIIREQQQVYLNFIRALDQFAK